MRTCAARLAIALLLCAAACSEPTSGPVRIVWGRHACDHCGMAISDPRFAAEVRVSPHEVMRFDDFGCAVAWLEAHGGPAAATEFWVMDSAGRDWIDARRAFYRPGQLTPMAYGFTAQQSRTPDGVDFESARRSVLEQQHDRSARPQP